MSKYQWMAKNDFMLCAACNMHNYLEAVAWWLWEANSYYVEHKRDTKYFICVYSSLGEDIMFLFIDPMFYERNFLEGQKINWGNKPHVSDMNGMTLLNAALNVLNSTPKQLDG